MSVGTPLSAESAALDAHPVDVPENVAEQLVEYIRSNTIRNEQQFLLLNYANATCFLDNPKHFNCTVVIGTSSSGKTHMRDKADALYTHVPTYEMTSGTDKSMIHDEEWDEKKLALLDELQKPPEELIEFLKGVHGGDEKVTHRITRGNPAQGFEVEKIERYAMPYTFLYAQQHTDADFEMWNRLLKISIHESESKNRAVGAMAGDHEGIQIGDEDVSYGFDYREGKRKLQEHIKLANAHDPYNVYIPHGERYEFDVWDVIEPIFKHSRTEVNRIYWMVFNEIRGSAALNFHTRPTIDTEDGECLVATPQDVANVLRCRQVLLATTHELDRKKRAVVHAITRRGGKAKEVIGAEPIIDELENSDAPTVKRDELEKILEELQANYIVDIHEDAADGKHAVYEALGWDELGFANVEQYSEHFAETTEPIDGEPFLEWHRAYREELGTTGQDIMEKGSVSSASTSGSSSNSGGLSSFGGGVDETDSVDLDQTEQLALERAQLLDGVEIEDLSDMPVEAFLGLVRPNEGVSGVEPDGTVLDPDHDLWDRSDRDDSWIQSTDQARSELKRAIETLTAEDYITYADVHDRDDDGKAVRATLAVDSMDST